MGRREENNNKEMEMKKMSQKGFTLVEIMIVVAIIGLLAAIAIPSFMKARTTSQQKACINNLRQIEAGKEQWALSEKKAQGADVVNSEVNLYMKTVPVCPAGGTYAYLTIGTDATCTITDPLVHKLN
jgi:prepilin-type N-terminal cleavage/methylation domain-containing protein